ncbi:hypothetical protein BX666DRAFT_164647 [Dichotomocladium elegans]|nr:hypothetical protein BX666DRAFT_164647 [Dichotomocladium elegans]
MLGNNSFLNPASITASNHNNSPSNQSSNFADIWSTGVTTSHSNHSNATNPINPFGDTLLVDRPQTSPTTTVLSVAPSISYTNASIKTITPSSASKLTTSAVVTKRRSTQLCTPAAAYARAQKPYSYAEGYHYLIRHVRQNMTREDLMRISRALALFRPSVLASMMNLTEDDLIFTEKCLQRTLLEHEKLISYSGTPTAVWRRTGEIALVGKEFSLLTQWSRDALLSKKTYIFELMSNASAVEYWEKYALHAFDNTDTAVYSSCILQSPTKRAVPCTFCFTIKRDIFDLPSIIIGNFLPILS